LSERLIHNVRWAGHVASIEEVKNTCKSLVGKPEGKRPCIRPRHRWEGNIKMDLWEVGWEDVDWIIWLRLGTSGRPL
jgi:hypothetical protein